MLGQSAEDLRRSGAGRFRFGPKGYLVINSRNNYRAELDSILPLVEKPARYVGGEWNAIHKSAEEVHTRLALCFPDTYEIGMSHLGLKILYSLLNKREGWAAERVYAAWPDMEAKLRERRIPLL